jgi:ACS family allantoate permease-like MFS transporter
MSFPEDTIQLCSVIIAGVASQVFSNFRCGLMILANIIVLIGAVLVSSKYLTARVMTRAYIHSAT